MLVKQLKMKGKKGGFLGMFLGMFGTSLLWNLLAGKGVKIKIPGREIISDGEGTIRDTILILKYFE